MNYKLHYEKLISKAQNRSILKSEYKEIHHIIPVCMNGSDDKDNLIALFPEEHIVAHLLLTKIHPDNYGLLKASNCMTNGFNKCSRITNKKYAWLKKKYSERLSNEILANPIHLRPGVLEKMSKRMSGENNPLKLEHNRKKQSDRMKGDNNISNRPEVQEKMKESRKKYFETHAGPNTGKKASAETKQKQSESAKNRKTINRKKLYHLINPTGEITICDGTLKKNVDLLHLSFNTLMINRGCVVPIVNNKGTTQLRKNTNGWKLLEISH